MPAEVDYYMGRKSAWHNLGDVIGDYFSIDDILVDGKLGWTVSKRQLEYDGILLDAWGTFRDDKELPDAFLDTVGPDYTVIQHSEGLKFLDTLVQGKGNAHYETAGALRGGRIVWGLINLGAVAGIKGTDDITNSYLLFKTGHDGSMSYDFRCCNERVVCANTLNIALSEGTTAFKVRHTKNYADRISEAESLLARYDATLTGFNEKINFLADRFVNKDTLVSVLDRLFPSDENGNRSTRSENNIKKVLQNFENNDGNAIPIIRGTAYNLLNAFTEYTDHDRSVKGGSIRNRAESAMFGSGDVFKSNAFKTIMKEADSMPTRHSMQYAQAAVQA